MKSVFVKIALPCLALPCLALSMLCVQALDRAEGEYFAGTSIGFSLLYSDLDLKSYPCRFLFHNYYEQDLSSYGNWVDLDESKYTPLMVKRKRCNINPAISLGYSFSNENWYLGVFGEVSFGESCNYESLSDGLTLKSEISGFSGTFKLKGGYRFADLNALVYGITGIRWRSIKTQLHFSDEGDIAISRNKAKFINPQWIFGLGVEYPVCKKLSILAEYEYAWRNSTDVNVLIGGDKIYKFRMKQRLRNYSFRLGVNYHI